jgi:PGF-pre-PGF domain-containing protein
MSKMKFIVAFVLLITMCTGVASATWTSSIYVTALPTSSDGSSPPPPLTTYVRTFGVNDSATDGFDRDYDVTAPPAPQGGALDAYFPCSHEVVTRLSTDIKADADTITWTLKVTVPDSSTVDMNWDASNAPSDKMLVMNTGSVSINMKTQSSTIFETGSYSLSITSSKVVQDDSTPPTSSGGGSGGSGSSGEKYENIEIKDVVRKQIVIDKEITYEFKEESNAIDTITFTALQNAGEILATIEVLKDTSSLVKTAPSGRVYQNMNIWVGKFGFATSNNIADAKIGFKVEKSWIEENDIVVSMIRLCRYYDDVWNPLPTKKIGEDDKYIYFEAKTPGFSPFSIIGSTEEEVAVQSPAASLMSSPATDSMSSTATEQISTQSPNEAVSKVWFVVGALVVMLIGGGAYWMYRAKKD